MKLRKILKTAAVVASVALTIAGKRKAATIAEKAADALKKPTPAP